ncbi:MAG: PIG-L family deacetylase [Planctomycetales bacterium]|nr:PIG-L family deacetylase [Planctomycetales bacterium]
MNRDTSANRILVLGAHPDDAELSAGGLIVRHCRRGTRVRIVSVTDGRGGHHEISSEDLVPIRRREARAAGERVGADVDVWDFHDGALEPSLALRAAIIREIRTFAPDLVLTHRPNDYHPDHRAVGTAVQDASYMVTVPRVCPETPALRSDPVVAYMCDLFTRPNPLRPDVVLDVSSEFDLAAQMAACHESQFFQWLPYHDGILEQVPEADEERFEWFCGWLEEVHGRRRQHFQAALTARGLPLETKPKVEVYEVSEYAAKVDAARLAALFPDAL